MRNKAAAFLALFAAAALFCACALVYFDANAAELALETATLYGDADAARGVRVEDEVRLNDRLVWELGADLTDGSHDTKSHWELMRRRAGNYEHEPEPEIMVKQPYLSGKYYNIDEETVFDYPFQERIYRELAAKLEGDGIVSERIKLADYVENYELYAYYSPDGRGFDGTADYTFTLPVPESAVVEVTLERDGGSDDLDINHVMPQNYYSQSVYDGEDIYLLFDAREDGELLDGAALPGGDWGVYRVPVSDGGADFENVENIYALGTEWESARLTVEPERERLLLFTGEDGGVYLTVIDTESDCVLGRMELISAEEIAALGWGDESALLHDMNVYTGSGYFAVKIRDIVAAAEQYAGAYERLFVLGLSSLPTPDGERSTGGQRLDFVRDGERFIMLESGETYAEPRGVYPHYRRVCVFERGELAYCGWLECQLDTGLMEYAWMSSGTYNPLEYSLRFDASVYVDTAEGGRQ